MKGQAAVGIFTPLLFPFLAVMQLHCVRFNQVAFALQKYGAINYTPLFNTFELIKRHYTMEIYH